MIGIDTNVLLRYLLDDDITQSPIARDLIASHTDVLVSNVVLAEAVWTLTGKKYRAKPVDIIRTLNLLFQEPAIVFENAQTVWSALQMFEAAMQADGATPDFPDFPDVLILSIAKQSAIDMNEPLDGVYSFDRATHTLPVMYSIVAIDATLLREQFYETSSGDLCD